MMSKCPLNIDLIERLLRREVPGEERDALLTHLESDCPECLDFFTQMDSSKEEMIAALYLSHPTRAAGETLLSAEAKTRILNVVESQLSKQFITETGNTVKSPGSWQKWRILPLAAGIILAVGLALFYKLDHEPGPTIKGGVELGKPGVILQFSVIKDYMGKAPARKITRGVNRGVYNAGDHLLFRYEIDGEARVYIIRAGGDQGGELIYPASENEDEIRQAGVYDANRGKDYLAYSLEGISGLQTFCAVALAGSGPDAEKALSVVSKEMAISKDINESRIRRRGMDCFQVKVERWEPRKYDSGQD